MAASPSISEILRVLAEFKRQHQKEYHLHLRNEYQKNKGLISVDENAEEIESCEELLIDD